MLQRVAEGVSVRSSGFMQTNTTVIDGADGVLVVDAGVTSAELASLAGELGRPVVAGFSTHPHWDHLLWHAGLGAAPRYGTAIAAGAIGARLADPNWRSFVAGMLPPEIADEVPLDDHFGRITGLPEATERIPWDGPAVRIVEHGAHAPGHAALVVDGRVLVAGDMVSDILIPIINFMSPDPVGDYLAGLQLLEDAAGGVEVVIPGHGSVDDAAELRARIERDRAYLEALRDGREVDDSRLSGPQGEAMTGVHERQREHLA